MTATLWDKEFYEAVKEWILLGTLDPTSTSYCYTIAGVAPLVTGPADQFGQVVGNEPISSLYQNIFNNAFDYFYNWQDGAEVVYGDNYQW